MSAILGMRGTGSFPADHRPENWREKFLMLEPNGSAPLTAILSMLQSEKTDDPVYHNFRKDLPDFRFTQSGAQPTITDTTLTATQAADLSYFRSGMLIRNFRTGEVVKITAKPTTTTVTVTRGVGNSGTGIAIADADVWFLVGNANPEGADTPTPISWDAASNENYTQIFRTPVSVTRTMMKTNFRTGNQYVEKTRDALKQHMMELERAFIWGKKDSITGANGQPERYTGGIVSFLTTNVRDLASASTPNKMSESEFDSWLAEDVFAFGSSQKLALCGWRAADNLQKIAKDRWSMNSAGSNMTYGMSLVQYMTFAGELVVKTHPQWRQIPGAEDMMLILDTQDLRFRFIDDTMLLKDRQGNGIDGVVDEYLTEAGLEMLQEKTHALLLGWQGIS